MPRGPFSVLRHREFRTVWTAMFVSDVGTWMQVGALGIFVAESTGKAAWVGVIATVSYLATGLISPLGGTLADRHDRRRVVAVGVSAQAGVAVALTASFAAGGQGPLLLTLLAGAQGALTALVQPPVAREPGETGLGQVLSRYRRVASSPAAAVPKGSA